MDFIPANEKWERTFFLKTSQINKMAEKKSTFIIIFNSYETLCFLKF